MLHIKCDHCGAELKSKEIIVKPFDAHIENIKYKDYATTCTKCGGIILWDKYVQKANENKIKAFQKKGKKFSEYNTIMHKVSKRAKQLADARGVSPTRLKDLSLAINELPQNEKSIVLAQEDKENMAILQGECHKPADHIQSNSVLLFAQAIIECAIVDKDKDFFRSNYGKNIVNMYNAALTLYTMHDYEITAELLLEKMQKGKIDLNVNETRRKV